MAKGQKRVFKTIPSGRPRVPLEDRFWKKVLKTETCWLWRGAVRWPGGYGILGLPGEKGGSISTHRFSYQLHFGAIPLGVLVYHYCDNPPCVRPSHLFLGSAMDNMVDKVLKGRAAFGTRNGNTNLTEDEVRAIRQRRREGEPLKSIAGDYAISVAAVSKIALRRNWIYLD